MDSYGATSKESKKIKTVRFSLDSVPESPLIPDAESVSEVINTYCGIAESKPQATSSMIDHGCCSLMNSSWSYFNRQVPKPLLPVNPSERIYGSAHVPDCIVTINVKQIGPNDVPHHPADFERNQTFQRGAWGLAINSRTEQIYVTDFETHTILVFKPDGEYIGSIGGEGTVPGLFKSPAGIVYDAANDWIVVVDKDNHRVQVFNATTEKFVLSFGTHGKNPGQFDYPHGVAVSADGTRIAVSDPHNARVQLFKSSGYFLRSYDLTGVSAPTSAYNSAPNKPYPFGLAFDMEGMNIFVTDLLLCTVVRINLTTSRSEVMLELLQNPSGIAVDYHGNILVCDASSQHLKIYKNNGAFLGLVVSIGGVYNQMLQDVAVHPFGQVALMDGNGRIRVF